MVAKKRIEAGIPEMIAMRMLNNISTEAVAMQARFVIPTKTRTKHMMATSAEKGRPSIGPQPRPPGTELQEISGETAQKLYKKALFLYRYNLEKINKMCYDVFGILCNKMREIAFTFAVTIHYYIDSNDPVN